MGKDSVIIITDVDGTILPASELEISAVNREAAYLLIGSGGFLTLATGRGCTSSGGIHRSLNANLPAVLFNGSCIYDFANERALFELYQPKIVVDLIQELMEKFSHCGIIMSDTVQDYIVRADEEMVGFLKAYNTPYNYVDPSYAPKMLKVLVTCRPEEVSEVYDFLWQNLHDELTLTRSGKNYIEILPSGCSKALGLQKLAEIIDVDIKNMIAIGDYHNDIEMLEAVGLPVTVESAPDVVKAICRHIVNDPEHGSLPHLLRILNEVHGLDVGQFHV